MIYTVTFNPALDYVVKVDHFTLGTVNRTEQEDIYCGGKGLNVSTVLATLGFGNTDFEVILFMLNKECPESM